MDLVTTLVVTTGLGLALVGTVTLVAWRHGRSRASVPALILALAVAILAAPAIIEVAGEAIDPSPQDVVGHPEDAVVHPDDLVRR